jgi:glycosyltransferase involved in cell wall biosynthesis
MMGRPTVGIAYRFLPHYRIGFFSALHDALVGDGIDLQLSYGLASAPGAAPAPELPWALPIRNRTLAMGNKPPLVWQSIPPAVRRADLVVLMQESRVLSNFPVIASGLAGRARVALWGHGLNFEQEHGSRTNRFKLFYSRRVHWWFAYTQGVANVLLATGFPAERITIVENSIDTELLRRTARDMNDASIGAFRNQLGVPVGPTAIFCGRLYARKRVDFLLEAGERIRKQLPGFQLIIIGDGPDTEKVRAFAAAHSWVHYAGAFFEQDIVPYFRLADVCLMPGAVGLTILDAFALETPLVTTRLPDHGPEIEYLVQEQNGIMTENTLDAYVEGAIRVLSSPPLRDKLKDGCRDSAAHYTLQNMVRNFQRGVHGALETPS